MTLRLPRYVIAKPLASGATGFYFTIPTRYRQMGCAIPNEPLGSDYAVACGADGNGGRALALNGLFDEWWKIKNGEQVESIARYGTVDWLFREYKASERYKKRVSQRTRPDYERLMQIVIELPTKRGDRVGQRPIKSITPRAADKLYEQVCAGPNGPRPRQGEKVVALCRAAWRVVHRLYPDCFDRDVPNPWDGVTMDQRTKQTKPAVTRDQVYQFAWGAIEAGRPEAAAAAVICFEFLQRPENVLAGYLSWPDYRRKEHPTALRINHHKTGAVVWHPLETVEDGVTVKLYENAEAVLYRLPRRGVAMILKPRRDGTAEPYTIMQMGKLVRKLRDRLDLPPEFTLDACRHGGMTELEQAELTDGQGRALSGHRTQRAYEGYAKRSLERALPATLKRHAYALANAQGTTVQNGPASAVQNESQTETAAIA
jgi:hypothetical protein